MFKRFIKKVRIMVAVWKGYDIYTVITIDKTKGTTTFK